MERGRTRITIEDLSSVRIWQLLVAYLRAVERFRTVEGVDAERQLLSNGAGLAPLAEALNWADSIDSYLRHGPRGVLGSPRDADWVEGLPAADRALAIGFQYVRNQVHHAWWMAIALQVDGAERSEWVWARTASRGWRDTAGRDAYEEALAGHRMLDTLDALAALFWARRGARISREEILQPGHGVGSPIRFDYE